MPFFHYLSMSLHKICKMILKGNLEIIFFKVHAFTMGFKMSFLLNFLVNHAVAFTDESSEEGDDKSLDKCIQVDITKSSLTSILKPSPGIRMK